MTEKAENLYKAKGCSLWEIFNSNSGNAGFKIPIYQREYEWDEEKILRLFVDCINGISSLNFRDQSFTFLGTIILTDDSEKESTFDCSSLQVVDGQQRLTTFSLIACALIERLLKNRSNIPSLDNSSLSNCLESEFISLVKNLSQCIVGKIEQITGNSVSFPRIIREKNKDKRASDQIHAEYISCIANFLNQFDQYLSSAVGSRIYNPFCFSPQEEDGVFKRFISNWEEIREIVSAISDKDDSKYEIIVDFPKEDLFSQASFSQLFRKFSSADKSEKLINQAIEIDEVLPFLRICMFATYFINNVALTRVIARDESYAFDIFDALNTTGEPLTALETFKPKIIEFESTQGKYIGSASELNFTKVEHAINERNSRTEDRQNKTKELIISIALYVDGFKTTNKLADQRRWLRDTYQKLNRTTNLVENKRRFVQLMQDISDYRLKYWDDEGLQSIFPNTHNASEKEVALCLRFLKDLKNSLTIPILTRFYIENRNEKKEEFYKAVKALTAFVLIRRAVTNGTAGIDTDLRQLMQKGPKNGDGRGLKCGIDCPKELITIQEFKSYLKSYLAQIKIGITDKNSWVNKVVNQGTDSTKSPILRMLLLASSHRAGSDTSSNGLLSRSGMRDSDENNFLTLEKWQHKNYETVEHVAPKSNKGGWDTNIYDSGEYIKYSIGNLTLLPKVENSIVGNSSWQKKKNFYRAFSAEVSSEVEAAFESAKNDGFDFGKYAEKLINNGERLPMLVAVASTDQWDADFIKKRSENIASLAWDAISPWLFLD